MYGGTLRKGFSLFLSCVLSFISSHSFRFASGCFMYLTAHSAIGSELPSLRRFCLRFPNRRKVNGHFQRQGILKKIGNIQRRNKTGTSASRERTKGVARSIKSTKQGQILFMGSTALLEAGLTDFTNTRYIHDR